MTRQRHVHISGASVEVAGWQLDAHAPPLALHVLADVLTSPTRPLGSLILQQCYFITRQVPSRQLGSIAVGTARCRSIMLDVHPPDRPPPLFMCPINAAPGSSRQLRRLYMCAAVT